MERYEVKLTEAEYQRLLQAHERYEKLRRLTPAEFQGLYRRNICGGERFDDLVDKLK